MIKFGKSRWRRWVVLETSSISKKNYILEDKSEKFSYWLIISGFVFPSSFLSILFCSFSLFLLFIFYFYYYYFLTKTMAGQDWFSFLIDLVFSYWRLFLWILMHGIVFQVGREATWERVYNLLHQAHQYKSTLRGARKVPNKCFKS